jgi:hypothetical protein
MLGEEPIGRRLLYRATVPMGLRSHLYSEMRWEKALSRRTGKGLAEGTHWESSLTAGEESLLMESAREELDHVKGLVECVSTGESSLTGRRTF